MYKQVFIAEKPSVASEFASFLSREHGWRIDDRKRAEGCFVLPEGKVAVTYCDGRLYENLMPEDYPDLKGMPAPWVPRKWMIRAKDPRAAAQIKNVQNLVRQSEFIINGGDSDREGQRLVDELLEMSGVNPDGKNVLRIWVSAMNEASLRQAFADLQPNMNYRGFRLASLARSRADWLVGINGSNALHRATGQRKGISMGRVQSVVNEMVRARCELIRNFKPVNHFIPWLQMADGTVIRWKSSETPMDGVDEEGRILRREVAEAILQRALKAPWLVTDCDTKERIEHPPLPHSQDSLQAKFGKRFGVGKILETAQALYEQKVLSYPRSDCRYLPTSMMADRPRILKGIAHLFPKELQGANVDQKSRAYDDSKVTAHHGIVPTGNTPGAMNEIEKVVYNECVRNFLAQMHPPARHSDFKLGIQFGGNDNFVAASSKLIVPGWRLAYGLADADEETADHPENEKRLDHGIEASR